ncbi:hypothetical protein IQ07DRAFT_304132 [Pyrenochaeta sp. DS3sAY3a]|nr:hypothetical protein IQ07DRAFT_304132 [Pyrenochaeta sp. DS3sAY3a]
MAPPNIEEMKERESSSSEHHESQARRNRWRLSRTSTVRLRWATQIVAVGAATVANLVIDGYQSARKAQHSRAEQHSSRTASGFVFWSLLDPFSSPSEPEQSVTTASSPNIHSGPQRRPSCSRLLCLQHRNELLLPHPQRGQISADNTYMRDTQRVGGRIGIDAGSRVRDHRSGSLGGYDLVAAERCRT